MNSFEINHTELVVTENENGIEVRRPSATDDSDPFVGVAIFDHPESTPPYSNVRTMGVSRYDDVEKLGRNSSSEMGKATKIEIQTRLITPEKRNEVAQRVAALAFMLADSK